MLRLINGKRRAHVDYQHDQRSTSLNRLCEARKIFRRTARKLANEFWSKTNVSIQAAADRGNTKSVYDEIRKAVGPTKKLTSPLQSATGEILHSRDEKLGRLVQHFFFLYSKQNVVTDAALQHM